MRSSSRAFREIVAADAILDVLLRDAGSESVAAVVADLAPQAAVDDPALLPVVAGQPNTLLQTAGM